MSVTRRIEYEPLDDPTKAPEPCFQVVDIRPKASMNVQRLDIKGFAKVAYLISPQLEHPSYLGPIQLPMAPHLTDSYWTALVQLGPSADFTPERKECFGAAHPR